MRWPSWLGVWHYRLDRWWRDGACWLFGHRPAVEMESLVTNSMTFFGERTVSEGYRQIDRYCPRCYQTENRAKLDRWREAVEFEGEA